jgi:hypothetical protein
VRDPYVANVLEPLVPASTETGEWNDVLRRADLLQRRRRSHFALVIALVVLALGITIPVGVAQEWTFPFFPRPDDVIGEPKPSGPRVLLAEGEIAGQRWTYTAQMTDHGVCVDIAFAQSSGGGCGFGVRGEPRTTHGPWPAQHWVGSNTTSQANAVFAAGPVAKGVESVEIVLSSGRTVRADIVEAPEALGAPLGFYLAILPSTATIETLIAEDANGSVLERTS